MTFVFVWLSVCGGIALIATAPLWFDIVAVGVLRNNRIILYPEAVRFAISLEHDREWKFDDYDATHPRIGMVRASCVSGLYVRLKAGTDYHDSLCWNPNFIERRIIWDAYKAARQRVIDEALNQAINTPNGYR